MNIPLPLLPKPVRWLAVATVAGFIAYNSLTTAPPETVIDDAQPWFAPLSYWRHFLAYAALAYTLAYALERVDGTAIESGLRSRWQIALGVIALATLFGTGIEVGQYFLPERHFDLLDVLVNTIGASTVLVWYAVRPALELKPLGELRQPRST